MNKKEFERIQELPDYMSCKELEEEFAKIITETQNANSENKGFLLEAYFELAERQWSTYKILNSSFLKQIDSILISLWNKESVEDTEALLGTIAMLGLTDTFNLVKTNLNRKPPENVKREILEAIEEFGDTVANPYAGN